MLSYHNSPRNSVTEMNVLRNIPKSEWKEFCVRRDSEKGIRYYKCDVCDAQFSEYRYLQQHKLTQHYHPCWGCEKKFPAKRSLEKHMLSYLADDPCAHRDPEQGIWYYKCDMCDAQFSDGRELDQHC